MISDRSDAVVESERVERRGVVAAPRFGPRVSSLDLDLLPIPAVIVERTEHGFQFEALNRPFRRAGLGSIAELSPLITLLGPRIAKFLASDETHMNFPWQFGGSIDCRHFQVSLARRASARDGTHCLITLVDQTSELRTEKNFRREMMTDSLTGLPNRAGFSERIEAAIEIDGDDRARYAVLVIDLDRFSRVNAVMGAMVGDELLITVARRLKSALRAHDLLARTGGDEFGILLALDEGPQEALHVADRIQSALSSPFRLSDFDVRVACSIGIAFGNEAVSEGEDMIRHAQFAVKRSKTSGRTEIYQTRVFDIARERFGMETELRRAIENGALKLFFQPICDLATGRVVAFESLSRWTNEAGIEFSPTDFIPVAEESGLIVPLGRWAIEEAARTLALWDAQAGRALDVSCAVNLSAIQLQRDMIAPIVERALSENGLTGARFTLELTESALITDPDSIARTMRALKQLGTTLAMDDFGTGYSNLAYLQRLPIDVLKIDRSFVTGMMQDRDKVSIVRAVLSLAHALGMRTTAEGIETNELAQTLAALGCSYGQGFFYARPLAADAAYSYFMAQGG